MDPLNYGKLLDQTNNKFIILLTTKNIAVLTQNEKENFVKIFKNGELVLEYKDKFIQENYFSRYILNSRFLFKNDKLISTQILSVLNNFIPFIILLKYPDNLFNYLYLQLSITPFINESSKLSIKDRLFPE
jgi:hypothetical protein